MPASSVLKTKRDLLIEIGEVAAWDAAGATSTGVSAAFVCDEGLTISGGHKAIQTYLDRGSFGSTPKVRFGDDQPFEITLKLKMSEFTDAAAVTPMDLFLDDGFVASDFVSTLGANAEVKAYMLKVTAEGTDHGDSADHFLLWNHVTVEACDFAEGDWNEWSTTLRVHQPAPFGSA
jgi:hypothetical protein